MGGMEKMEPEANQALRAKSRSGLLLAVSYTLNLPAVFIWAAVLLRRGGQGGGEAMAAWLTANFSELTILGMWLMLPSSALIFALGGYAINGKRWLSISAVALSTLLLLSLAYWATELR